MDVQDPQNLTVRQRIESFGINAHLKLQWVVPEQEAWFVPEEFHIMSGFGQKLRVYHTSFGDYSVANQELIFNERKEESGQTGDGFWISAATSKPPNSAIVTGRDLPKSLALVTFKGSLATIEPELRLADLGFSENPHLLRYGPYLFMVSSEATAPSSRLLVFKEGETLEKLYSLDIEHNSPAGISAFTLMEPRSE